MATCQRCGIKLCRQDEKIGVYCYQCREKREREIANEKLVRNLDYCRKGEAMQNAQRIYDAFVSEYPGALLTGIDVKDSGNMLLLYLDGKPAYFAKMNVLTGKATLEKYDNAPASTSTPSKKNSGCLTSCFIVLAVLLVLIWALEHQTPSTKTSSPKVTVRPTATAPANDVESWVKYYANKNMPDDMHLGSVQYLPLTSRLYVICDMDTMWNGKAYLRACSEFITGFCENVKNLDGFETVILTFNGPFIDREGNDITAVGVKAEYSVEKLRRLNFDYFDNYTRSDPAKIIKAADDYTISPAYLD